MDDISGKVALVTGGSRGIGRAIAAELVRAGVDVAIGYRSDDAAAHSAVQELAASGRRVIAVRADVSRAEEVARLVERVTTELGAIDILVNNAGIAKPSGIAELNEALWNETIQVNLTSVFLVTQAVVAGMRERRWGRIVNLTSTAAQIGGVVGPHYAASKAGIIGLTHGYASQLAREGITCNALAPALIETDMVTSNPRAKHDMIPIGRFGTPEETAGAALLLIRNAYITGQTLNVNGGIYLSS